MNLLALETTGSEASVALLLEDGTIVSQSSPEKLNHLRGLIPLMADLLEKCKLTLGDLSGIAVSEGPGSFTGIRIGISTARALAQALNLETIGVPTLRTFAYHVPAYQGLICPLFDARRSQVYSAAYVWKEQQGIRTIQEVIEAKAYSIEELLEKIAAYVRQEKTEKARNIMFFGDGIAPYEETINTWVKTWSQSFAQEPIQVEFATEEQRYQKAESVVKLAQVLYVQGKGKPYEELKPVYMRKAEAERKLEAQRAVREKKQQDTHNEAGELFHG